MIAKAIKEEHPRPRPLHLTVEHFFKGYPGFSMLAAEDRRGARPTRPTSTACSSTRSSSCSSSPRAARGPRSSTSDRYRLRRFGRGGFVEAAMRARAPIVPIAVVGAEEAQPIFAHVSALSSA